MRSTSSPRAVSMRTGTWDFCRRRRRISKPSMPGSITSSTTRSTPGWRALSRPRLPSSAESTVKPSRRRNSPRRVASSASSSTSRMFTARIYHAGGAGSPSGVPKRAPVQFNAASELRSDGQGRALSHLRLQRAQRVAHDDALPAEVEQGEVVGLGKVAPLIVGGKQVVGTGAAVEVGLISVAAGPGGALVDKNPAGKPSDKADEHLGCNDRVGAI